MPKFGTSRLIIALALVLSAVFTFALPSAQAQSAGGRVRVAHMSPDAPAVDIYVDGQRALSNVAFKTVSDYLPLPAGEHRFEVRPAGSAATGAAVIDAKATIEAGKDYTVAAIGPLAQITALVTGDDNTAPGANKAKVKVVHASPDAPAVDVAVKGGPVLINNLAFGKASNTLAVDAATYDLEVRAAGTNTVALPLAGTKLEAGKIYTVFASGRLASLAPVVKVVEASAGQGGGLVGSAPATMPASGLGGGSDSGPAYWLAAVLLAVVMGGAALGLRRFSGRAAGK